MIRSTLVDPRTAALTAAVTILLAGSAMGQVTFTFEDDAHEESSIVAGDKPFFITTDETSYTGTRSLKFNGRVHEPYESFTYDVPFDTFTSGVVSVWFYDTRGPWNTGHGAPTAGGSIILEDKDNPQDFVALEVLSFPYGARNIPSYYGSEGTVDRLKPNDRFDSANLTSRTIGLHKVEFHVSETDTRLFVDGTQALEVAGPGSTSNLRLRFMIDSPSNGGSAQNWITHPRATTYGTADEWLYFDEITFSRELPSPAEHSHGFEIVEGEATYDSAGTPSTPGGAGTPPADNPYMNGFVNQWAVTNDSEVVAAGSQAAYFSNATAALKSITFDLDGAAPNTSASLYFYDALGQDVGFDKNNSIILENADDPAEFIAVEINNWPYPYSSAEKNYYLVEGVPGSPATSNFWSGCFPARSSFWHRVEIGFYETYSLISVDGALGHRNNPALIAHGPGLDKRLRLRLMADGASQGGSRNWTEVNELTALYQISDEPYVYYDNISLPLPADASVDSWMLY